jgi:hypothetical protein
VTAEIVLMNAVFVMAAVLPMVTVTVMEIQMIAAAIVVVITQIAAEVVI